MKRIVTYILVVIGLVSCTKFDDLAKDGSITDPTPAELKAIAPYKELLDIIDDNGWWFWAQEVTSDEIVFPTRLTDWDDGGKWRVLHTHKWTNDVDAVNSMWSQIYDIVNECNRNIEDLEFSGNTSQETLNIIGELKVLRAFAYYLLIDNYGDVPLITSFSDAPKQPVKTPRNEIYSYIITDIKENINGLPVIGPKSFATKGMAFTLLAKLYLNAEVYTGISDYTNAEAYCDSVIDLGIYSLDANSVLSAFAVDNAQSPDHIFNISFDQDKRQGFRLHMRTLHYLHDATFGMAVGPWNGFAAVEDHYNSYSANDKRKSEWFITGLQKDIDGNTLFDETAGTNLVITPEIPALIMGSNFTLAEIRMSGARVKKYEIEKGAQENLNNDFPLFRYGDVLLMKAECAVRNGGPGSGDQWLQDIRDRANAGPTNGFGLDEILAERGRELFCEGHRRQDLIRFGKFGNPWWEKQASGPERNTFPIPQWAIDANSNLGL